VNVLSIVEGTLFDVTQRLSHCRSMFFNRNSLLFLRWLVFVVDCLIHFEKEFEVAKIRHK
jgi:hypothetical protein